MDTRHQGDTWTSSALRSSGLLWAPPHPLSQKLRPEEAFWSSDWLPPHTARVVCFGSHDPNRWRVYITQPDGEWLLGSISGTKNLLCDGLVAHSQCGRHWLIWKHLLITAEQSWNCFPWKMTKTSFRVKVLTRLKQQTSKETFKKSF